ncbi:calcium-binding protein, partial [Azotobacter salinestris]|uniref:calcium-binding protein n=1 Tax=Azotobacter salinestris TaxID=69964 RepID=UPI0032E01918
TATATATVSGIVTPVNDVPVAASTSVWLASDPAQQGADYGDGYSLLVSVPTDVDGDNLVVTAANAPTGVFYYNGSTYVAVTNTTVLYDSANGVNFLNNLVYRPTATVNDTPVTPLNLQANDGKATTAYSVEIHEVGPNRLPAESVETGDGKSPLTSGNNYNTAFTLSQGFVDGISSNLAGATIKVLTDFQEAPFNTPVPLSEQNPTADYKDKNAGNQREKELQVELWIGNNKFAIVEDDPNAASFEQSWFYDAGTGLMAATVSYANIYLLDSNGVATTTTLAQYLTSHPASAGDTWTLNYYDNDGGNYQARSAKFEFYYNDPGDAGIVVVGDSSKANLIYGTSSIDNLTGGSLDDTIIGRSGNDVINGGGGNDTLNGGAGNDILDGGAGVDILDLSDASAGITFTLVQSSNNTTVNLSGVGLGTDTYRNVEGVQGSDFADTLTGSSGNDILIGGLGNDTLIGGSGDDILIGGQGDDILTGGSGADTFIWRSGDTGNDVITDFKPGEGDTLDLSDLLQGATESNILDFLQLDQGTSTLRISTTGEFGAGGSGVADATIQLKDGAGAPANLSSYGSSAEQIISAMVEQSVAKVEHS